MMNTFLNLAGFGMKAWDPTSLRPDDPFTYRATTLPSFDRNLRFISSKLAPTCLVAHVRGVTYSGEAVVADTNLHPFHFAGARVVLAHNGHLRQFARMRYSLIEHVRPELAQRIEGTTDSEWIYALILSQLDDPYGAARDPRAGRRHRRTPSASCATSAPRTASTPPRRSTSASAPAARVVATRVSFDYGWYPPEDEMLETDLPFVSLWYAIGGEYTERDGELADDGRRSAPLGDHRLRAAHDRLLDLARGAGVLDADRRAHAGRARVRDARPGCLTARPSTSSPRVPLLEGRDEADLAELARVMRRRTVQEGEILWRQGDDARELALIVDGAVSASLQVTGDRAAEIGRAGPGEIVGEIGAARRRGARDERARDRDRDGARARPAGLRGAARRPATRRRSG